MASGLYNKWKLGQLNGNAVVDFDTDTINVMLLKSTYTPDFDNDDFVNDIRAHEVSCAGYTAGGLALASKTATADTVNDWTNIDAADPTWSIPSGATLTCRYGAIYKVVGTTDGGMPLVALMDFGADKVTPGANAFTIRFAENAYLRAG